MNCPRCRGALVDHELSSAAHLATCAACGGAWLDPATTRRLRDGVVGPNQATTADLAASAELAAAARESAARASREPRTAPVIGCPECGARMDRERIAGAFELDTCSAHGSWFDRGELEQLAQVFEARRERPDETAARIERSDARWETASAVGGALARVLRHVRLW